jgi:hypothetical protein
MRLSVLGISSARPRTPLPEAISIALRPPIFSLSHTTSSADGSM